MHYLDLYARYDSVVRHYDEHRDVRGFERKISGTVYEPSQITFLYRGFEQLLSEKIIDVSTPFFDAGFGTGECLAVAGIFGFPSYGLEHRPELVEETQKHIAQLKAQDTIPSNVPIVFGQGNFLDDAAYEPLGMRFKNIPVFFNFISSHLELADKIARESPIGTLFLLHRGQHEMNYPGFRHVQRFSLKDRDDLSPCYSGYLHVYEKTYEIPVHYMVWYPDNE